MLRRAPLMSLAVARTLVALLLHDDFVDNGLVVAYGSTVQQVFVCLSTAPHSAAFVNRVDKA